ncbi:MAG: HDOD domain-containing protein [Candidatus Hydrogenedentes bacterium]|nr:HDOD domain-containing protein [Candidatus Hydrogenedentota bacterium]
MSSDATMMLLICSCGQKMKVATTSLGKTVRCVKCGERLSITADNTKQIPTDVVAARSETPPLPPQATHTAGSAADVAEKGPFKGPAAPAGSEPQQTARIGALLIQNGLITNTQLQEALTVQKERGGKTFELLIELGYLDKRALHEFFSKQPGIASIDLANYQINTDLATLIPKEFALDRVILPLDKLGKLLTVGMACPIDTVTIKAVEEMTGLRVKAMLCRLDDIHAAVQKYYRDPNQPEQHATLESFGLAKLALRPEDAAPLLSQLLALPASSRTIERLKHTGADAPVQEVARIAAQDPPFAASILTLANSSAYGFPKRVDTIGFALSLLGAAGIRELTLAAESAAQTHNAVAVDTLALEASSVFCAKAAKAIAKVACPGKEAIAYVAGLLHEIGRYALANIMPERYVKLDQSLPGPALLKAEKQAFTLTHPEAGYSAASRWGLPVTIVEPIRRHHEPEKATDAKDIVAVVALASVMSDAASATDGQASQDPFADCGQLLKSLRLDKPTAQRILSEVVASASEKS